MKIKIQHILLVAILFAMPSCQKSEPAPLDELDQLGITGQWKLESRTVDGITSLIIECCDYIEFKVDNEPDDLKGEFISFGVGYETVGQFEINRTENSIDFYYNNQQKTYDFRIQNDLILFTYFENDQEITESWKKSF
jgi:hypothetical protein